MQMKRGTAIDITHQLTPNVAIILSQWIGGYTVIKNQKTQAAKIAYQTWFDSGQLSEDRPVVNTQVAYLNETLPFLRELPAQIRRNAGAKWFEAMSAAKSGLRKQPTIRHKHQKRNCYVTNELFDVQALDEQRCIVHLKSNAKKGNASTIGEKRALAKVAKLRNKQTHISDNNAHHLSKDIAVNTPLVASFENMTISNLMKAPKAKICPDTGKWLRNGRAAKKGLNKVLKLANMGKIRQLSAYKLAERGKLLIQVKTAHSSQTCSVCGYVDKGNRLSQAIFHCQSCHHEENADTNAAKVLQQRGLMHLRSEMFTVSKTVRKISARKIKGCEKTSLGRGDHVRLSLGQAKVNDALNRELTTA